MALQKEILLICIAFLVTISHAQNRTKRMYALCPPHFVRIGGQCYYISDAKENWLGAHFACKDRNSRLAEPIKLEDRRLRKYLQQMDGDRSIKWIGGRFNWGKHNWQWGYNGNLMTYQSFSQMTPGGSQDLTYHCAALNPELKYRWSARMCTDEYHFVCQHRMPYVSEMNRYKIYTKWNESYPNEMANEIEVVLKENQDGSIDRRRFTSFNENLSNTMSTLNRRRNRDPIRLRAKPKPKPNLFSPDMSSGRFANSDGHVAMNFTRGRRPNGRMSPDGRMRRRKQRKMTTTTPIPTTVAPPTSDDISNNIDNTDEQRQADRNREEQIRQREENQQRISHQRRQEEHRRRTKEMRQQEEERRQEEMRRQQAARRRQENDQRQQSTTTYQTDSPIRQRGNTELREKEEKRLAETRQMLGIERATDKVFVPKTTTARPLPPSSRFRDEDQLQREAELEQIRQEEQAKMREYERQQREQNEEQKRILELQRLQDEEKIQRDEMERLNEIEKRQQEARATQEEIIRKENLEREERVRQREREHKERELEDKERENLEMERQKEERERQIEEQRLQQEMLEKESEERRVQEETRQKEELERRRQHEAKQRRLEERRRNKEARERENNARERENETNEVITPAPVDDARVEKARADMEKKKITRNALRERLAKLTPEQQELFFALRAERNKKRQTKETTNDTVIP